MSECKYWNNEHKECSISNNTYEQGIADERERIIAELELLEVDVEYMNQYDAGFNSAIYKALEIVRGEKNE